MFFGKKPDDGRVRLMEVMRLRRAYLPDPLSREAARDLEEAKQRCAACMRKTLCDELLASGAKDGFGLFCPNHHYIQQLRSSSLTFS
jgi:hypothetical protein